MLLTTQLRQKNLHNHNIPGPSVVSTFVKHSIVLVVSASPRLTTDDLAAGRGLQFVPGAVDTAAASKDKLRGIRKKALEDGGHRRGKKMPSLPWTIISLWCRLRYDSGFQSSIAENIWQRPRDGRTGELQSLGYPYMHNYCISPDISYQFIMSPFMSKVMASADFIQVDVTYGQN